MNTADERLPLLGHAGRKGRASTSQAFGNIIVSIVGTGVLGLPYTFRVSGWAPALGSIVLAGSLTYYCMMLLVRCRYKLEKMGHLNISTYGDIGGQTYGKSGRYIAETMVLISQCGGCVAYMVFIGQNMSSTFTGSNEKYSLFVFSLVPVEIALAWVRSLSSLAPFSVFADICNVLAMGIVIKDNFHFFTGLNKISPLTNLGGLPFVAGVAVFSYEGFSMTLILESSMRKTHKFGKVLGLALLLITAVYIGFGFSGYAAYGNQTQDIITLNLPNDWSTVAVKIGLCIALVLTFPVMMYPVHEMFEEKLLESSWFHKLCFSSPSVQKILLNTLRGICIVTLAILASSVPGFGIFVSLVGSTVSALLAFVFPTLLHLNIFNGCLSFHVRALDLIILVFGIAFAFYGSFTACVDIFIRPSESPSTQTN
eukprot:Gb_34829 [translate_table: standard]